MSRTGSGPGVWFARLSRLVIKKARNGPFGFQSRCVQGHTGCLVVAQLV